jgi:hypothetical protein
MADQGALSQISYANSRARQILAAATRIREGITICVAVPGSSGRFATLANEPARSEAHGAAYPSGAGASMPVLATSPVHPRIVEKSALHKS